MADILYFADLTAIVTVDPTKILAVQTDPVTGIKGFKLTLAQAKDFVNAGLTGGKTIEGGTLTTETLILNNNATDNLGVTVNGDGSLSVNAPNYETLVTGDDDIPNLKKVNDLIPVGLTESFTVTIGGQLSFTITVGTPASPTTAILVVQGQTREYGVTKDFTISGNIITWYNNDYTMQLNDLVQIWFDMAAGAAAPVDSVFGRTGAVVAADSDYDASQVSYTGVPGATVAAALDYNNTKENVVSKAFGDSPYAANIGEVVLVDTSGGAVSIVLPAASTNSGGRIRVTKVTSDANVVTVDTTGGDTISGQPSWGLSHLGDGLTGISNGVSDWPLITERHASGFLYFLPDHDANQGSHRVQTISATANSNFEFRMPSDFLSIISLTVELTPSAGAAGSGKDIDLTSDYGTQGEAFNNHSETDTGTVYDFTGLTDTFSEIDLSPVFTGLAANDICGVNIDHNGIGGAMDYYGIALTYRKRS